VEKATKHHVDPLSAPVTASLAAEREVTRADADTRMLDIDLGVLRKDLEVGLTLQLTNDRGRELLLEQPQRFQSDYPGLYRVRIAIPDGLLRDAPFAAKLIAEIGVVGSEPGPPRELLAFEVTGNGDEGAEEPPAEIPIFEQPPDLDALDSSPLEVEWSVSRTSD
jgi:hypothetical protein